MSAKPTEGAIHNSSFKIAFVSAQGAEPLTFVNRDKSKQKHFVAKGPKVKRITAKGFRYLHSRNLSKVYLRL